MRFVTWTGNALLLQDLIIAEMEFATFPTAIQVAETEAAAISQNAFVCLGKQVANAPINR
jgi:hypothetical protein